MDHMQYKHTMALMTLLVKFKIGSAVDGVWWTANRYSTWKNMV